MCGVSSLEHGAQLASKHHVLFCHFFGRFVIGSFPVGRSGHFANVYSADILGSFTRPLEHWTQ